MRGEAQAQDIDAWVRLLGRVVHRLERGATRERGTIDARIHAKAFMKGIVACLQYIYYSSAMDGPRMVDVIPSYCC